MPALRRRVRVVWVSLAVPIHWAPRRRFQWLLTSLTGTAPSKGEGNSVVYIASRAAGIVLMGGD